jgi:hypothetical protein
MVPKILSIAKGIQANSKYAIPKFEEYVRIKENDLPKSSSKNDKEEEIEKNEIKSIIKNIIAIIIWGYAAGSASAIVIGGVLTGGVSLIEATVFVLSAISLAAISWFMVENKETFKKEKR